MKVDIGICTFRRSTLFDTLETISTQVLPPDVSVNVIVVDNDEQSLIKETVQASINALGLSGKYVFAPKFNISIARNACLDAATGDVLVFIDDDELANPDWLARFVEAYNTTDAGVIFGPTRATYPDHAPAWMKAIQPHSNQPMPRNGVVETGFSGNVLLDRSCLALNSLRFDEAFGKTGGEDVDFFFRASRAGVPMAICLDAIVDEPVTPPRMSLRWLLRRKHAVGKIYGHCTLDGRGKSRVALFGVATLKCAYCVTRSAMTALSKERSIFWLLRGAMHAGVISGSLSRPSRQAYGIANP